jgi:hypothetical protein
MFFFSPTFCPNEEFKKKLCCKIPVFAKKRLPDFSFLFENISPHSDFDFSLVAFS